jgi:hypothetical protein
LQIDDKLILLARDVQLSGYFGEMSQEVIFWADDEHVKALREFLTALASPKRLRSAERLHELIVSGQFAISASEVPKEGAFRNFIKGESVLRTPRHLTRLLEVGVRIVELSGDDSLKQERVCKEAARLLKELTPKLSADEAGQSGRVRTSAVARGSRIALDALRGKEVNQRALNERLFANCKVDEATGRRQRQYWCYRYHSHPGWVVKSKLILKEPPADRLFPEFQCEFTHGGGARRQTAGWVLAMGRAVYFFGQIGDGAGLKMIAVPTFDDPEHKAYPGLILAMDEDGTPIAGRCVLVRTDDDPSSGGGQILDERSSDDEGLNYRAQFQNRMKFTLDSEILFEGDPIDQGAMVHMVRNLLKGKFTYKDGRPFNPADTIHYTFNVALRKYDAANDDN